MLNVGGGIMVSALSSGCNSNLQASSNLALSLEKLLHYASTTGELILAGRNLKEFPKHCCKFQLKDTVSADLSRNKLTELPQECTDYFLLERLVLYNNTIRSIPDSIIYMQSLQFLDLSRNQLSYIPPALCELPLQALVLNNNRLVSLPEEIGKMQTLMELDASCNEIAHLPVQIGDLASLKSLNLRRNHLQEVPVEISFLQLTFLDLSGNRISVLPVELRFMTTVIELNLGENPLSCPPANLVSRGRIHVFKYLEIQAIKEDRKRGVLTDSEYRRSYRKTTQLNDFRFGSGFGADARRKRHTADSGYGSEQPLDRRWSQEFGHEENSAKPIAQVGHANGIPSSAASSSGSMLPPPATPSMPMKPEDQVKVPTAISGHESPDDLEKEERRRAAQKVFGKQGQYREQLRQQRVQQQQQHPAQHPPTTTAGRMSYVGFNGSAPAINGSANPDLSNLVADKLHISSNDSLNNNNHNNSSNSINNHHNEINNRLRSFDMKAMQKEAVLSYVKSKQSSPARSISSAHSEYSVSSTKSYFQQHHATSTTTSTLGMNNGRLSSTTTTTTSIPLPSNASTSSSSSVASSTNGLRYVGNAASKMPVGQPSSAAGHRLPQPPITSYTARRDAEKSASADAHINHLREQIEARLRISLPEDLSSALIDGVILCHLANHVKPRSVPTIHVPSPAVPKLTPAKCRRNVENFLLACRRIGVREDLICSPADILEPRKKGTVRLAISVAEVLRFHQPKEAK